MMETPANRSLPEWIADVAAKLGRKMPYAIQKAREPEGIPYTAKGSQWLTGPQDGVCWWTSGFWPGALAACALIDLSRMVKGETSARYFTQALRLLQAMEKQDADWELGCPAVFRRCRPAYHGERPMPTRYGNHFFIEAVNRLRGESYPMW